MKLKSGDRIVFHKTKSNKACKPADITLGRIYAITHVDADGDAYINDDVGDHNGFALIAAKWTKIVD